MRTHIPQAVSQARNEGSEGIFEFREARAEDLPFPDSSFDGPLPFKVIQAIAADKMLGEMMLVTKPGGRIGLLANAADRPKFNNFPLWAELKPEAVRVVLPIQEGVPMPAYTGGFTMWG